ncbi:unnamed protein product [Orchesella dallaii]|uniref:Uncharacterized protein n=1 Tax=Orchesella dallaii TaxID=48710 RepID=A0ABP1QRJ2_9HEXA
MHVTRYGKKFCLQPHVSSLTLFALIFFSRGRKPRQNAVKDLTSHPRLQNGVKVCKERSLCRSTISTLYGITIMAPSLPSLSSSIRQSSSLSSFVIIRLLLPITVM